MSIVAEQSNSSMADVKLRTAAHAGTSSKILPYGVATSDDDLILTSKLMFDDTLIYDGVSHNKLLFVQLPPKRQHFSTTTILTFPQVLPLCFSMTGI